MPRNTSGLRRGGGHSPGRPKGSPNKSTAELRQFAGQYSQAAITGLVAIAKSSKSDQARVAAWNAVLDRAVGKPPQAVTGEDGAPLVFPEVVNVILRQALGADNHT